MGHQALSELICWVDMGFYPDATSSSRLSTGTFWRRAQIEAGDVAGFFLRSQGRGRLSTIQPARVSDGVTYQILYTSQSCDDSFMGGHC